MKHLVRTVVITMGVVAVAIQFVPYGHDHTNPPILAEPNWDTPKTRELVRRACFDCHSNEVTWPGYSHIAPVSWFVQRDVELGRQALNFSEWTKPQEEAGDAAESVTSGEMPLRPYLWMHPSARLDVTEKAALVRGLNSTFGSELRGKIGGDAATEDEDARAPANSSASSTR